MAYTDRQRSAINTTERVGASLSFLGCSFVILTFVFSKRFRRPVNRIMFYASIGNLIYTIPGFIGLSGMNMGQDSSLCQAQAFLIQAALPSDALWNLSLALNVYFTVFKGNDMAQLQKREPIYLIANSAVPFIIALVLLFTQTPDHSHIYGDAAIWCWISSEWEFLRILACYGIAWVCILIAFTIYILVGLKIRKERRKLLEHSLENGHYGRSHLPSLNITAQTTVQTMIAEKRPVTPVSFKQAAPPTYLPHKPPSHHRYQVHISTTPARPDHMVYSDPVRRYTKSCVLFFISLLMTWVPSSINRVWALTHPGQSAPFALAYTAAFVLQLTGFWNSLVYAVMSRTACKELVQYDLLPKFGMMREVTTPEPQRRRPLLWCDTDGEAISKGSIGLTETRVMKDSCFVDISPVEEDLRLPDQAMAATNRHGPHT